MSHRTCSYIKHGSMLTQAREVYRTEGLYGKPYTKAVDMWSLGIVALCLLTGEPLASYLEMKHISQVDIAARLDRLRPDPESQNQWNYLTDQAKDFLTKLLMLDPADRMTADQAVAHSWFTHPSKIGRELNRLYQRSVQGWVPRRVIDNMIESIPRDEIPEGTIIVLQRPRQANFDEPHQASQKEKRRSRKDCTASVYFSLDKHTRSHSNGQARGREATQRSKQQIINVLKESGELFVKDGDVSSYTSPRRKRAHASLRGIRDVPPTDLFGEAPASLNSQQSQSKKSSNLSQYSGNGDSPRNYVDSSQTQLEQPSLPSESSGLLSSRYECRAIKRRRLDTSTCDCWFADDEYVRPSDLEEEWNKYCEDAI